MQQAGIGDAAIRMNAAIVGHHLFPGGLALLENGRIEQLRAIELVLVQIRDDLVAVVNKGDRPAKRGFRADMADDEADRSAGEARIGHQRHHNAALTAQRGDARGRVEHFRHARCATRPVVAHDDHVVVLENVRRLVERIEQALLALEHARLAAEQIVLQPAFDAGKLQDGGKFRRQIAAEHAQAAGRLVGLCDGIDHLAVDRLGAEALDLLRQRFAGAGHHVAVEEAGFQQFADDHLHAADLVDVDHRIFAIRPRVGEDRNDILRQMVELGRRHHLFPEVGKAGGARDLRRMQA